VSEFDASNSINAPVTSPPGKNNPATDSQHTHQSFARIVAESFVEMSAPDVKWYFSVLT
jgi:hypothetical protein